MNEKTPPNFSCHHYDRNDWLKVDVNSLLAPWVDRVSEIYLVGKKPGKYIVTYALAAIAVPQAQAIMDIVSAILDEPGTFQKRYGTRLAPSLPDVSILTNAEGIRPPAPRQVNFMDVVDFWAVPINRIFGVGIGQCRDVVKITLTFFLADHSHPLSRVIEELVKTPSNELFKGEGKVVFGSLDVVCLE